MANYQFLDAYGSVLSAASSVVGGIQYPIVKISDPINITGSVITVGTPVVNQSVSGTIGASIIGLTPVAVTNIPSISGTVNIGTIPGSVIGFQGGTWNVSIATVIPGVAATNLGKTEDAAAADGDTGVFMLGVRNDTLASITSSDKDYTQWTVGPAGETITANAPLTKWVQGVGSIFTGVIQPIVVAQGASVFTYITSGQAVNNSANNVYLTLYGATDSVVGYLPVPANSGAIPFMANGWKGNANGAFSASVSGVASVFLSLQGFISKT